MTQKRLNKIKFGELNLAMFRVSLHQAQSYLEIPSPPLLVC